MDRSMRTDELTVAQRLVGGPGRRGDRPQQEVLHRRFFGFNLRPGKPGQDVERYGEQFQRQEDHNEIGCGGHQHHPADGEEHEHVIFPAHHIHAF